MFWSKDFEELKIGMHIYYNKGYYQITHLSYDKTKCPWIGLGYDDPKKLSEVQGGLSVTPPKVKRRYWKWVYVSDNSIEEPGFFDKDGIGYKNRGAIRVNDCIKLENVYIDVYIDVEIE